MEDVRLDFPKHSRERDWTSLWCPYPCLRLFASGIHSSHPKFGASFKNPALTSRPPGTEVHDANYAAQEDTESYVRSCCRHWRMRFLRPQYCVSSARALP